MKIISIFFNTIAGIFRMFMTLVFLLGLAFTFFVDRNLLTSFYDILGFDSISPEIVKILTAILFLFAFFVNFTVTNHIFKANKTGRYHLLNMFFAFIFILIDIGIYFFVRESKVIYPIIFSSFLILGSMFGLIAKAKGLYPQTEDSPVMKDQMQIIISEDMDGNIENDNMKEMKGDFKENYNEEISSEESINESVDDQEVYDKNFNNDKKDDSIDENDSSINTRASLDEKSIEKEEISVDESNKETEVSDDESKKQAEILDNKIESNKIQELDINDKEDLKIEDKSENKDLSSQE